MGQKWLEETYEHMAETKLNWWKQTKVGGIGDTGPEHVLFLHLQTLQFFYVKLQFIFCQAKPS